MSEGVPLSAVEDGLAPGMSILERYCREVFAECEECYGWNWPMDRLGVDGDEEDEC